MDDKKEYKMEGEATLKLSFRGTEKEFQREFRNMMEAMVELHRYSITIEHNGMEILAFVPVNDVPDPDDEEDFYAVPA